MKINCKDLFDLLHLSTAHYYKCICR